MLMMTLEKFDTWFACSVTNRTDWEVHVPRQISYSLLFFQSVLFFRLEK